MTWRVAALLTALSLAALVAYADEPATNIRTSIAKVKFRREPTSRRVLQSQNAPASRDDANEAVVVGLSVLGMYAGMLVAGRVASHSDDQESAWTRWTHRRHCRRDRRHVITSR